jgi:hypothetical protein
MLQKNSFFCVFALLLTGLQWWSSHVDGIAQRSLQLENALGNHSKSEEARSQEERAAEGVRSELRRELLEALDRLVYLENDYHSVFGYYTQVLNHAGFSVSARLARHYEIRVEAVSKSHFQVSAFSEEQGKIQDRVWVDQLFRVTSNFPMPSPSAEYLKLRASQRVKWLVNQDPDHLPAEKGIFTGYFRYEIRKDSDNRPVAVAVGIRSPVLGVELEARPQSGMLGESRDLGQFVAGQFLAQQGPETAFWQNLSGKVGQTAKDWSELAHFALDDEVSLLDEKSGLEKTGNRQVAAVPGANPSKSEPTSARAARGQLIIESISK